MSIARVTDKVSDHTCPNDPHLDNTIITGSNNCFANDLSIAREGDIVSCGDTLNVGSPDVFVNDLSCNRNSDPTTFHSGQCSPAFINTGSFNVFVN